MTSELTVTRIAIHAKGESPIHGDGVITVELDDEGGGEFIVIRSQHDDGRVTMDPEELPLLIEAARRLLEQNP